MAGLRFGASLDLNWSHPSLLCNWQHHVVAVCLSLAPFWVRTRDLSTQYAGIHFGAGGILPNHQ